MRRIVTIAALVAIILVALVQFVPPLGEVGAGWLSVQDQAYGGETR